MSRPDVHHIPRKRSNPRKGVSGKQRHRRPEHDLRPVPDWLRARMTDAQVYWYERDHPSFINLFHYLINASIPLPTFGPDAVGIVGGYRPHAERLDILPCDMSRRVLRLFDLGLVRRPDAVKQGCWLINIELPADKPRLPEGGDL